MEGNRMERAEFLESSVLQSASYDVTINLLTVTFKSGRSYDFFDVPPSIWEEFKKAESKGRFFTQNIKGKFKPRGL